MFKKITAFLAIATSCFLCADNQTATVSPILPQDSLPYTVEVELADFMLPFGLHSYAFGIHDGKWLIVAGRINGLHGFGPGDNSFPPDQQNTLVYVIDHHKKRVWTRNLQAADSGISQEVVDTLSVTSPQFYQSKNTLYMTGGYGVITATGEFSTKDTLTAIDIPGLIKWAMVQTSNTASQYIRQIHNPIFQVTGGEMTQIGHNPTLLVFGQNFAGYYHPNTTGEYTQQIRRFTIHDDGKNLSVTIEDPFPADPYPDFHRRDLNVVPIMEHRECDTKPALMAYSGVFTLSVGGWTIPVTIMPDGSATTENADDPLTFKQGMNNYICPTLGLYSEKNREMYTLFFGGISYGYFEDGQFETDDQLPFINQITTIKRDKFLHQTQYLMDASYPTIYSQGSNPGNELLFGAGAAFFPKTNTSYYENGVVKFDQLKKGKTHIGYIVGGIQSTMPDTNDNSDSAGAPYIFKVYINKK